MDGLAPTIDTHAHVFLQGILGQAGDLGPELGEEGGVPFFRSGGFVIPGAQPWDGPMGAVEARHALMDRLGIDLQVVTPIPHVFYVRLDPAVAVRFARLHNDCMAEYVAQSPRLWGAATLPLQDPAAAVAELERCVTELGLVASYTGADAGDRLLCDPCFEDLWAAHEALDVALMIHAGPSAVEGETPLAVQRWALETTFGFPIGEALAGAHLILGGVLDRHPRLRVHVAHGGGFLPYQKGRLGLSVTRAAKVAMSRPFEDQWRQLTFDSALHGKPSLDALIALAGPEQVVVGTNFGGWDQEDGIVELIRESSCGDAEKQLMLGGNAQRLFPAIGRDLARSV